MPGPAVYVAVAVVSVAVAGLAFHEFVYEPHIAPKVEAWAESYLERRRQRRRRQQGPVLSQPVNESGHDSENTSRRPANDANSTSIELEQLAARERDEWRQPAGSSGLTHRRTAGALDESDTFVSHAVMSPTHVIFDTSTPSSPGSSGLCTSAIPSLDNSPAYPTLSLSQPEPAIPQSPDRSPQVMSPRLPTPISKISLPSSRAITPTTVLSERFPLSLRQPPPDLNASLAVPSLYNTPLAGSILFDDSLTDAHNDPFQNPSPRVQSPFSDIHSVDARSSSPEHVSSTGEPIASPPRIRSPSSASDLTLSSDEEFDVLSPRSGMFSPESRSLHADEDPFEVGSQHGSEVSWASVGRHSPSHDF